MAVPQGTVEEGINVFYTSIALLCQTFLFGIFTLLVAYSVYMVKRKRRAGERTHWLLYCTLFAFALSSAFWGASVANLLLRIHGYFIHPSAVLALDLDIYGSVGNAVVLINYLITDGIVVWRAWVLCRGESGRLLYIPVTLFALTSLSVSGTITIRVILTVLSAQGRRKPGASGDALVWAINVTQVAGLVLSLLSNMSATSIVALRTWRHRVAMRKFMREAESLGNRAETILALLVESGFIYCIIGIVVIVSTVIRLPHGTLGDLFLPSAAQITGIYPTMILIVINMRATMDETVFDTAGSSTLNFAPPTRMASENRSRSTHISPEGQRHPLTRTFDVDKPLPQHHSATELGSEDMGGIPLVHALDSCGSLSGDSEVRVPRKRKDFGNTYHI